MRRVISTTMTANESGGVEQEPVAVEVERTDVNEVALHIGPGTPEGKSHYFMAVDAALIGYQMIEAAEEAARDDG